MKRLLKDIEAITRCRMRTLAEISVAAAILEISRAQRVRIWTRLAPPLDHLVAVTGMADGSGLQVLDDDLDIRAAARPLREEPLLARVCERHGQLLDEGRSGGRCRHVFPVGSGGRIGRFVDIDGVDPARIVFYADYRSGEGWKLDMARLLRCA